MAKRLKDAAAKNAKTLFTKGKAKFEKHVSSLARGEVWAVDSLGPDFMGVVVTMRFSPTGKDGYAGMVYIRARGNWAPDCTWDGTYEVEVWMDMPSTKKSAWYTLTEVPLADLTPEKVFSRVVG